MRGEIPTADRLARAGLAAASGSADSWHCLASLSLVELSRGAYADGVEHALAAAALATRPSDNVGIAALCATYAGDLDRARVLSQQMAIIATSPTLIAFSEYIAGEIDSTTGRGDRAERHYAHAIDLARTAGATFLEGIATVGRLSLLAHSNRIGEALRGYDEVINYWARTGNWIQQWTTLRNLAALLHDLGEHEPATALINAAEHAPDAPLVGDAGSHRPIVMAPSDATAAPPLGRTQVLQVARQAINRSLART